MTSVVELEGAELIYRTCAIITRSWFETTLDYKPRGEKFAWGEKAKHYKNKKFVDNAQQCFAFTPQANFPTNDLNVHWRWRWLDQIQATF